MGSAIDNRDIIAAFMARERSELVYGLLMNHPSYLSMSHANIYLGVEPMLLLRYKYSRLKLDQSNSISPGSSLPPATMHSVKVSESYLRICWWNRK